MARRVTLAPAVVTRVTGLALLTLLVVTAARAGPGPRVRRDAQVGDDDDCADGGPCGAPGATGPADAAPSVCPERCVCRFEIRPKLVDCSNRKFTAFPDPADIPDDVEHLDLSHNDITSVPRFLPAWERLEVLDLSANQIPDFPANALSGLRSLELLDLSRNRIASLRHIRAEDFVADNAALKVLNLSGNALQSLGRGSFQSLRSASLQVLDVSHCAVSSIDPEEALAALPALRVLHANNNPLELLAPLRAPALRELDLSDCKLRAVRAAVFAPPAMHGLTHLAVNRNPDLTRFLPPGAPDTVAQLVNGTPAWSPSLQVLEAEDCALQDVSFLAALPNLTDARLRGNRVSALESLGLLDNGALVHLDLADNKIEELPPQAFTGTERLKHLDLSGNRLGTIHADTFAQHGALHTLNVSRNPLVTVLLTAPALRRLDASHAAVQALADGALDGAPQLRHLNLSGNPLAALPDRLLSPGAPAPAESALQTLDLSLCRLTDLSNTALDGLRALQSLDLRGNRLTDPLRREAFAENDVLQNLELADNPWRCDCKSKDFRDFLDFLMAHPVKEDVTSLTCHSPEKVQGATWYDACLDPGKGALASLDTWMFVVILGLSVALVTAGVFLVRRLTRGKAQRRLEQQQEQEEERRACEQEAARRRLHRRMQLEQQEQLRRQNMR
ncbi:Insulin-like growth factor-binding protein complex acid labile subunit, partial [Frankliniella fusca]